MTLCNGLQPRGAVRDHWLKQHSAVGVRWLEVALLFLKCLWVQTCTGEGAGWQVYLFVLAPGGDLGSCFSLLSVQPNPLINPLEWPHPSTHEGNYTLAHRVSKSARTASVPISPVSLPRRQISPDSCPWNLREFIEVYCTECKSVLSHRVCMFMELTVSF